MAGLGVGACLWPEDFVAAMNDCRLRDPRLAIEVSAIKWTVKGALGKLRESPRSEGRRPGRPCPVPRTSPLGFLPHREGRPLPGGCNLGVNPGPVMWEGTQSVLWDEGVRPLTGLHSRGRRRAGVRLLPRIRS